MNAPTDPGVVAMNRVWDELEDARVRFGRDPQVADLTADEWASIVEHGRRRRVSYIDVEGRRLFGLPVRLDFPTATAFGAAGALAAGLEPWAVAPGAPGRETVAVLTQGQALALVDVIRWARMQAMGEPPRTTDPRRTA